MKKLSIVSLALIVALFVGCTPKVEDFTFMHLSDTQVGFLDESEDYHVCDSLLKASVDAVNRVKPAFVVITGDLIHKPDDLLQKEIFKKRIAEIDPSVKVYCLPGNHDYIKYTEQSHDVYMEFIGYDHFSFVYNNCACIGFDTCPIKDGALEKEQEQLSWMTSELEKAQKCAKIFLFAHCPVIREKIDEEEDYFNFSKPQREKYMSLFKKYNVTAVFTGHTHEGFRTEYDGIKYVNAGPVCPPLGKGISGLAVVKVTNEGFDYNYSSAVDIK
ncbi:MAG: metallophosphoesterase [Alistipes sp.]|nr:metallophosphoesterase [Candidatus Alistipes equi]